MLDCASRIIPFLNHNDCIRNQMASTQTKQAIALLNPEIPFVRTGYEEQFLDYSSYLYLAKASGKVIYNDGELLIVKYHEHESEGEIINLGGETKNQDGFDKRLLTNLKVDEEFYEGDVLARHSSISEDGFLQLGSNLVTTYITDPYNFKDALVVSESCAKKMTIRYVYETVLKCEDTIPVIWYKGQISYPQGTFVNKADPIFRLKYRNPSTPTQLVHPGTLITTPVSGRLYYEIIVDEIVKTRKEEAYFETKYEESLSRQKNLCIVIDSVFSKDSYKADAYKRLYCPQVFVKRSGKSIILKYYIVQEDPINRGSKLSNRHGNKGEVSQIRPDHLMPKTKDGVTADIIVSPLSVPSRMNPGQLFELHMTRAMKIVLGKAREAQTLDEKKEIICDFLYKVQEKEITDILYNSFNLDTWESIDKSDGIQIIQRPFHCCTYERLLKACYELGMSEDLKEEMEEPYNGNDRAAFGMNYWYRLEHEPKKKTFARSVGHYGNIGQPVRGSKSHKVGEMEIWSLSGHQAWENIRELMGPKSDNITEAGRMIKYLHDGNERFYSPCNNEPGILRVFKMFLNSVGYDMHDVKKSKKQEEE